VKEHIHLEKATIQEVPELLAHLVKMCVGKHSDSHTHVAVFVASS